MFIILLTTVLRLEFFYAQVENDFVFVYLRHERKALQVNVKYHCNLCEYRTNRSDHYKRHLLVHSEEKPLKCATCGYGTGRSDHFK